MEIVFLILLFCIALLYSSVGHGGASGYLALMALFEVAPETMRTTSLTLNVFVAGIAFYNYYKGGYFRIRLILPFIITSVPFAFVGALLKVDAPIYKYILGAFLFFAAGRILFVPKPFHENATAPPLWLSLLIGILLGFFSGLIGIGGGIILSPLLILFHWAGMKETAAASAFFILLNSFSGLLALNITGLHYGSQMIVWIIIGVTGGIIGSLMGSLKFRSDFLKYPLAFILVVACVKLFFV